MSQERLRADDLRARVLAEIARTPAPTRAQHRARALAVGAAGVVATAALFFAMGGVHRGARPVDLVAFAAGLALVAAAVLTRVSAAKGRSMLGRPASVLVTASVATAPALALVAIAAAALWPDAASEEVAGRVHVACGAMTLVQGGLPLVALLVPRRGSDPVHPGVTGAALGMTAGAWAAAMAYLRCPHAAALHGLLAHVAPTLLLTAVGAVLGHALLRLRR